MRRAILLKEMISVASKMIVMADLIVHSQSLTAVKIRPCELS